MAKPSDSLVTRVVPGRLDTEVRHMEKQRWPVSGVFNFGPVRVEIKPEDGETSQYNMSDLTLSELRQRLDDIERLAKAVRDEIDRRLKG